MLHDDYKIRSQPIKNRTYNDENIKDFLKAFDSFYRMVNNNRAPDFKRTLVDPYGWSLLCKDYHGKSGFDGSCTCKQVFDGEGRLDDFHSEYWGAFEFKTLLNLLFRGFWFNYDRAMDLYNMQGSCLSVLKQIMGGNGYVGNRLKPNTSIASKAMRYASESTLNPDTDLMIRVPHIYRECDGLVWPCITMKYTGPYKLVTAECGDFGDGIFIVDNDYQIIDVLKINDLWLTDTGLENRLKFSSSCKELNTRNYVKTWSFRSTLEAGKLLGTDKHDGILVRSCRSNYYHNYWFRWYEGSLIYCTYQKKNNKLVKNGRHIPPKWHTLDGSEAIVDEYETREHDKVFLDDFDIQEFQKILTL